MVFQRSQIAAYGLFDGEQFGLVETAQAVVDMLQHADCALHVTRQHQLLRGLVQQSFGFVRQPVGAAFSQFLISFLRQDNLFGVCFLSAAQAFQFGLDNSLAVDVFFQQGSVFRLAQSSFVELL